MKYIVLTLGLLMMPQLARADQLRVTSYDMDDAGGTVRLESDGAIGEPWTKIDGKLVRIWFPHVTDIARFENERSSDDPIHALQLRPGASETAVLRIELGSSHRITSEDIEITRHGSQAQIALRVGPHKPAAESAAPARSSGASARPEPQLTAAEPAQPVAEPAPAAPPISAKPAAGVADKTEEDDDALPLQASKADAGSHSLIMLGISSMLLAGVYFGVQLWSKKRRRGEAAAPSIEVLGTRRLGHRQELMIVRALGADHLLLCTGGRAAHVASTPSPVLALPADTSSGEKAPASQAGGIGLISRLSSQHRLNKLLDSMDQESEAENEREHTGTFGAELYSAARSGKRPSLHSLPAPGTRQSEAVAGITRLRQRNH